MLCSRKGWGCSPQTLPASCFVMSSLLFLALDWSKLGQTLDASKIYTTSQSCVNSAADPKRSFIDKKAHKSLLTLSFLHLFGVRSFSTQSCMGYLSCPCSYSTLSTSFAQDVDVTLSWFLVYWSIMKGFLWGAKAYIWWKCCCKAWVPWLSVIRMAVEQLFSHTNDQNIWPSWLLCHRRWPLRR